MVYLRSCMQVLDQVAIVLLQFAFLFSPRGLTIFDGRGKLGKNKVKTKEWEESILQGVRRDRCARRFNKRAVWYKRDWEKSTARTRARNWTRKKLGAATYRTAEKNEVGEVFITSLDLRAVFNWVSKVISELLWYCITSLSDWFKVLAPFFQPIRSETKTNRGLRVHIFIGQSNYFGFGFTTLDWHSIETPSET